MTAYDASFNGSSLFGVAYTRDDAGRIAEKTETLFGLPTTYDYGYDTAGRLATVTRDNHAVATYTYDGNSNRQNSPASNPAYESRWLTRGSAWDPPYSLGEQAAEKLSLPEYNTADAVKEVPSRWNEWVEGPRPVKPDFGHAGGGTEYRIGGFR
jgi:YD repeat-containing protein